MEAGGLPPPGLAAPLADDDDPPTDTPSATPIGGVEEDDPNATPTNTPFPLLMTQVHARILPNSGANYGCFFAVTPGTTPVFTQDFSVVAFNPPPGVNIGCTPVANPNTRPFTDMVPGTPGIGCGAVAMQYPLSGTPTWQAGIGSLNTFRTAFTGQFYAPQAGEVTFNFWSDDGWVLGIGQNIAYPTTTPQQPHYVSGSFAPTPPPSPSPWPHTVLEDYLMVGRFDQGSGPAQNRNVTVAFPSAGYYPFELDYTECFTGTQLSLLMGTTAGNPIPPGPSATPTSTPTPTPTHAPTCAPAPYWCTSVSPNVNPGSNELHGVAAITKDDMWAVGSHNLYIGTDFASATLERECVDSRHSDTCWGPERCGEGADSGTNPRSMGGR